MRYQSLYHLPDLSSDRAFSFASPLAGGEPYRSPYRVCSWASARSPKRACATCSVSCCRCCFGSIDARIEPVLTSARNRASALGAEADVGSGQNRS